MLSKEIKEQIIELQKQYPEKRSALIPALHLAQASLGYLPRDVQNEIAELFNIEPNDVNAVVTFYDMFHEEPVGKHVLHVCKNVSCMLRGADELIDKLCDKLHVKPHGVTADGEFTVIPSECLGACDRAPMMIVDNKVVGPVKVEDLDRIFAEAKKNKGHASAVEPKESTHA
jgi:NADH-quinone oxidoreductase subunit E